MSSLEQQVAEQLGLPRRQDLDLDAIYKDDSAEQHYMMSFGTGGSSRFMDKYRSIRYIIQAQLSPALISSSSYIRRWAQLLQANSNP